MRKLFSLLFVACMAAPSSAATFSITHFGTPPDAQAAIQYAADIWGGILISDVPIKVSVSWSALGGAALGVTFPNGRKDFPSAPFASTWYATALANSIAGAELNVGEDDINVYLNSGTNWYLGTDGNTPAGQYDLVSIALHELGHGLGFVGLAKKVANEGSFGLLQASDFAPLITTFPWPEQDTLPGIFDRFLTSTANGPLTFLNNPSTVLGTAFTSNQVYFNGANAMAANSGQNARIYAPSVFALGSSCVHLNEATFPAGNPNELMTPFSSAGQSNHWPGPICLGILRDIGWNLAPDVGIAEHHLPSGHLYPDPATSEITIITGTPGRKEPFTIMDAFGRIALIGSISGPIDVSTLDAGAYLARGQTGWVTRFIKQ
ncbi:MAG: hypothetical protein IPP83_03480 [Flavobacteriales bacterium]|nr:hypothetical protein [Flavobacteriales bacterium]MBL0126520.1 hypothetical protein [Flavobacteriales bacterium]MCC6936610.1 zinc-dependent metalloprotease [Flavobacteriales bacterium]